MCASEHFNYNHHILLLISCLKAKSTRCQLRVALIAPPLISVPPADYGGTELFVAELAAGLQQMGKVVVVYTNGESNVGTERRWIYKHSQWPIKNQEQAWIRDLNHTSWAIRDAQQSCDLIHVQSAHSLPFTRFSRRPIL